VSLLLLEGDLLVCLAVGSVVTSSWKIVKRLGLFPSWDLWSGCGACHLRSGGKANHMTRVNSTNVLDEGLRIGEIGRRMNSKVKSVKQGVYRK
jgi:hypothetical protein